MKAMGKIRIYLRLLCFLLFIFGIVIPVALFIVTNNLYDQNAVSRGDLHLRGEPVLAAVHTHERKPLDYPESRDEVDVIRFQIKELEEIRASVRNELRTMDQQRIKLNKDLDSGKDTLTQLKKELGRTKMELQNTKGKLARASREANKGSLASPLQINPAPIVVVNMPPKTHVVEDPHVEVGRSKKTTQSEECTFQRCFDFSKCLHTKPFKVYVYNKFSPYNKLFDLKHPKIVSDLVRSLSATNSLTADASEACVYVCLVGPLTTQLDEEALLQKISQLSHWGRQGENHILVDMLYAESAQPSPLDSMPVGRAIVSYGHPALINEHHHILLPPVTIVSNEPLWKGLPPHLPATRQTLVHFTGSLNNGVSEAVITVDELKAIYDTISAKTSDKVIIETHCDDSDGDIRERNNQLEDRLSPTLLFRGEWALCGTHQTRLTSLATSTFSLVIGAKTGLNGFSTYTRLIEALRSGAIPVVTGVDHLPLEAVIDWKKAVVFLPASLIGELHYTLRHIDDNTILEYRRQGRFLWSTYFSSPLKILDSLLAVVRFKAHHPPPPPPSLQYHNLSTLVSIPSDTVRLISVPVFRYNFSVYSTDVWNSPPGPFTMYPLTPFQPAPVSGTQFMGMANHLNFPTHVIEGGGITGPFFEDYLLGNTPEEQFTIVLLTYKRNDVLLQALDYLHDLSYLAKVIVIWNSPSTPQSNMAWPDIGVPLEVCVFANLFCLPTIQLTNQSCMYM